MKTSFRTLLWDAPEEEYRTTGIHYSDISNYLTVGFQRSYEKEDISSSSLRIGSAVDTILTNGGQEAFNEQYYLSSGIIDEITKKYADFLDTSGDLIEFLDSIDYCKSFKPDTRIDRFKKKYDSSVEVYRKNKNKTALSVEEYETIQKCVAALKNHPSMWFFRLSEDSLDDIELMFQAKMKVDFGFLYSPVCIMFDLLIIDHKEKKIYPMDLKTCSCEDWNFFQNFTKFHYDVQARLYSLVLQKKIENTEFSDYKIDNFVFLCCSKKTFTPLLWEYPDNLKRGDLEYKEYVSKDPLKLAKEYDNIITNKPDLPENINYTETNNLLNFI